ncbi:hypothetical protein ScPMuIL_016851 [Solemya velum]
MISRRKELRLSENPNIEQVPGCDDDDGNLKDTAKLIYRISDRPPIHLTVLFGFQQALLPLANQLAMSLLVADIVCASRQDLFKTKLLSSTLFMNGVTTISMSIIGSRLPLFQGAAAEYVIPLLAMSTVDPAFCSAGDTPVGLNSTRNITDDTNMDVIISNVSQLQGSLMLAGVVHFLCGATGLVSFLLRFIGPITVVTAMLTIAVYMINPVMKFAEVYWGDKSFVRNFSILAIVLALYLEKQKMPVPIWNRKKGWHIIRYPLHQTLSMLISILAGWMVSGILTGYDVFPDDPESPQYLARTDARSNVIEISQWFYWPYPGQFGPVGFSAPAFVAFITATMFSILDSIGDYYVCAKISHVPPPPAHAVNRGILVEGLCSFFSGAVGCGHATASYGGNIGAIGVTKIASRWVFIAVGVIYLAFGIIGKFSAVFITIPYPVLGGALLTMIGMFTGVALSNLQMVSLSSTRNIAVIGMSIFVGIMIPAWIEKHPDAIQTGNDGADRVVKMLLGNPTLPGTLLAILLDNTVPGSLTERGMTTWQMTEENQTTESLAQYEEGYDVYRPWMPSKIRALDCLRHVPFLPDPPVRDDIEDAPRCTKDIPLTDSLPKSV